ncbi:uncharacterized protein LOC128160011 isoform X2 [Crassostrea angulata]|uniref:uncharacterized protein LOC128160011 isoform X2 n=1 Tax=Magallana angulata TaxID=2784310 RepID=UPI0022B15FB7|nr:uncharacterized protein LOC128160011 isoform X2 [Crassostrea angulata]
MGTSESKAKPVEVPNEKESTTPILESAEATCEDYNFNTTGCNITIQGKLLLVLDSINSTLRNYFSCFCEVVHARLNNTNVTTEILAGRNKTLCSNLDYHSNVDEVLLQEKLMNLTDYEELDKYAGMAVILTDRGFTSKNISALSDGKEPFVYFVNVGENESQNGSCYRQYRYVDDMTEINEIGLELESIACYPSSVYMNNSCMQEKPSSSTPSLAVVQASLPLIISITVVIALIMVVFIILFFIKKRKIQETCNKNTPLDDSAKDSRFEALDGPGKGAMPTNDIYNELRENEKRTYDDENQQNYHHLDLNFVKGDSDPSMYDHVTEKADHNEVFISSG